MYKPVQGRRTWTLSCAWHLSQKSSPSQDHPDRFAGAGSDTGYPAGRPDSCK